MRAADIADRAEKRVEHDLLRLPAHGQQRPDRHRQRQLSAAREGVRKVGMPRGARELRAMNALAEIEDLGLYE